MNSESTHVPRVVSAEEFTNPGPDQVNHRRYEALRAVFVDGATHAEVATRLGFTTWTVTNLVRDYRAGKLNMFADPGRPGPVKGATPGKDKARARVVELRREGLTQQEISDRLRQEGTPLNRTSVGQVLAEEGFGRLLRHPDPVASTSVATPGRDTRLPRAKVADLAPTGPVRTLHAGLFLLLPVLTRLGLPRIITGAGYQGTRTIPAPQWLLSLLALKLVGARRVSHVDDFLSDPAVALFAGMEHLPKKTALTEYSYTTTRDNQLMLLKGLGAALVEEGLTTGPGVFDLDFHSVMHWGNDPVLEKNYVPNRSQRARSVLTFVAQDHNNGALVYSDADCWKATQARKPIEFCDHWKQTTGTDPGVLVMDQKVTTHTELAELDARGITFITLRMRSTSLTQLINQLTDTDYTKISLDRAGKHNQPKVHDDPHVQISNYDRPGGVRQLIVTGLGHQKPTIIITNDRTSTARQLITTYAGRMNIEKRLEEIIRSFHADALSSTVNLNVDLDLTLCVLAQTAVATLARQLPEYTGKTPDTIQRRFLETPGTIQIEPHQISVTLDRRTYTPTLRQAHLPQDTPIPWWNNKPLHINLA